jgi:hypothetical protein
MPIVILGRNLRFLGLNVGTWQFIILIAVIVHHRLELRKEDKKNTELWNISKGRLDNFRRKYPVPYGGDLVGDYDLWWHYGDDALRYMFKDEYRYIICGNDDTAPCVMGWGKSTTSSDEMNVLRNLYRASHGDPIHQHEMNWKTQVRILNLETEEQFVRYMEVLMNLVHDYYKAKDKEFFPSLKLYKAKRTMERGTQFFGEGMYVLNIFSWFDERYEEFKDIEIIAETQDVITTGVREWLYPNDKNDSA